jgi:hypothetical protein
MCKCHQSNLKGEAADQRPQVIKEAKDEFWDGWGKEVFTTLLKQSKWIKLKRDVLEGDTVLRKDYSAASQSYKNAQVVRTSDRKDGKMRSADVEYTIPGVSRFGTITRPIHRWSPVEEQGMEEKQGGS